jgi:hypothetical protein
MRITCGRPVMSHRPYFAGRPAWARAPISSWNRPVGLLLVEFEGGGLRIVRADQTVAFAPALEHGGGFGAQNGVDAAELPADFPGDFEEQRLAHGGRGRRGSGNIFVGLLNRWR